MAINVGSAVDGDPMVEMNTTPLIDVMMVLLILFIITLPMLTNITRLDLPGRGPPEPVTRDTIDLAIDFDGAIVWNGSVLASREELERYFKAAAARGEEQPELHVRPDKRAEYDHVAHVLAAAQRSGLRYIGVVGGD